ncbi:MAG TPA: hypothetical protein VEV20_11255, partial [Burkholderiales bacterium]|nr:hypothetical protein [Burkholderiales bacterium]
MHDRSLPLLRGSWPQLAAILGVGVALSAAIVTWGFCLGEPIHLVWGRYFAEQLWSGDLYPRWLMDMNSGLGSPTFYFYGPVAFYVSSLFYAVVPAPDLGWPAIGLSASAALAVSGLAAFVWLRDIAGRNGALAGALTYMVLPYHLEIDILDRFAFGECWGLAWLPLVLAGAHRCTLGDKRAVPLLAFAYALLVLSHLPSTLLFSGVPVLYAVFVATKAQMKRAVMLVVAGMFAGGMLGAIYLLPAMTTQHYASVSAQVSGYFSYAQHFLFTNAPFDLPGKTQAFIDYALAFRSAVNRAARVTLGILLGGYLVTLLIVRAERSGKLRSATGPRSADPLRFATFWLAIAVAAAFMMSPSSVAIWRALPMLQQVQFPWRINIVLVCAAAAAVATACALLIEHAPKLRRNDGQQPSSVIVLAMVLAVGVVALLGSQIVSAARTLAELHAVGRNVPPQILVIDYEGARPNTLRREFFTQEVVQHLGESLPRVSVAQGTGTVEVVGWHPRRIVLAVDAQTDMQLVIKQLYYPGWTARSRTDNVVLPVAPADPI